MGGLIGALVLVYIAAHAVQSTWTFINIEKFRWTEAIIGYSLWYGWSVGSYCSGRIDAFY
ncbi:MAG: hypothetical protein WKG06_24240 [Segetibacter sp.]